MKNIKISKIQELALRSGVAKVINSLRDNLDVSNARDSKGNTLVHLAVRYRKLDLLELFLSWGVPRDVENTNRKTALDLAFENNLYKFIEILQRDSKEIDPAETTLILKESQQKLLGKTENFVQIESRDSPISSDNKNTLDAAVIKRKNLDSESNFYSSQFDIEQTVPKGNDTNVIFIETDTLIDEGMPSTYTFEQEVVASQWESESEIFKPENADNIQKISEKIIEDIQSFKPKIVLDESWSDIPITLPLVVEKSYETEFNYPELSEYLALIIKNQFIINWSEFYKFLDSLSPEQKPNFTDIEWRTKFDLLSIEVDGDSTIPAALFPSDEFDEVLDSVNLVLSEDFSLSELWVSRIYHQASDRDVLTKDGEIQIAIRMDAALIAIKELFKSNLFNGFKTKINEQLNDNYKVTNENSAAHNDIIASTTNLENGDEESSEYSTFFSYLLDDTEDLPTPVPRPNKDEINFLIDNIKELNQDLETKFTYQLKKYDDCLNQFFLSNIRLVFSIAKRYRVNSCVGLEDHIQFGFIGLMKAIERWDYTKGFKFSTYGSLWIRQSITRAIYDLSLSVRLPVHVSEELNKYKKEVNKFENIGIKPSIEEVAKGIELNIEKVKQLRDLEHNYVDIDQILNIDSSELLYMFDYSLIDVQEIVLNSYREKYITEALSHLKDNEQKILIKRFGLFGEDPHTLEEVGQEIGVTRERIRQIESKALKKLKRLSFSRYFDGEQIYLTHKNSEAFKTSEIINNEAQ